MASTATRIGFVRRGYSSTGGAEHYLTRFAGTLRQRGYGSVLFTGSGWPEDDPVFHDIHRLPDHSPIAFADALQKLRPHQHCDVLFSLERVWECDFYRAGDGVHRAWLDRRARAENALQGQLRKLTPKHRDILRLEKHLLAASNSTRIIANSELVKHEIVQFYGKRPSEIHVVYNGYKRPAVQGDPRSRIRAELGLAPDEIFLLFVGSGWERKGLRYAIQAVRHLQAKRARLFVIGRGKPMGLPRGPVTFLGPKDDVPPFYEAADLFLLPTLYDPFSNACLEASAHGVPVITTTANGFSEVIIHGQHGDVVTDPTDHLALAEALKPWLDASKREQARDAIRENAQKFHVRTNVDETLKLLLP